MGTARRERVEQLLTVPNLVTLSRLPLLVVLVFLLGSVWRYPLFVLIVFTDGFDGWLARRLDQKTELGAVLDPVLDKVTALFLFALLFPRVELPLTYLALFFARDAFVLVLGAFSPFLTVKHSDVTASTLGKAATNLQFATMVAMLVPHVPATRLLMWLLGIVSVFAVADYLVFVGRKMTTSDLFESKRAVVAVYAGVALLFVLVVRALLFEELLAVLELLP